MTRGPPEINDFRLNEIKINDNIARTSASKINVFRRATRTI